MNSLLSVASEWREIFVEDVAEFFEEILICHFRNLSNPKPGYPTGWISVLPTTARLFFSISKLSKMTKLHFSAEAHKRIKPVGNRTRNHCQLLVNGWSTIYYRETQTFYCYRDRIQKTPPKRRRPLRTVIIPEMSRNRNIE